MKLYDFLKEHNHDVDCWDDKYYDCVVTICYIEDSDIETQDSYDTFCVELYKKVEVSNPKEFLTGGCEIDCKWAKLIEDNIDKFWNFSLDHWNSDSMEYYAENSTDFIIAWIEELNYYVAGYVSEDFYEVLLQFVRTLKD